MRQKSSLDIQNQISRLIGTANSLMERYSRAMEEIDFIRLSLEELRELLSDYFSESGRNADRISERLQRLERLAILEKTHTNPRETQQIKSNISNDLRRDSLLATLAQEQRNLNHALERRAHYGFDVPTRLLNEIETYTERIEALKEELNDKTSTQQTT